MFLCDLKNNEIALSHEETNDAKFDCLKTDFISKNLIFIRLILSENFKNAVSRFAGFFSEEF